MGQKYTTQATTGYNSSPPSDDGAQSASNLITWAGIKSKLADVLKTFSEAINSSLVNAFDYSVRQVTSSDNTVASDHMRCVEIASTVTTAVTISLGDASTMTNVYRVFVKNSTARNQTVSRVTGGDTIDGAAANVTLAPGAGAIFQTNSGATGYVIDAFYGPTIDTNPIVVGGTDGTKKVRLEVDGLTAATTRVITVPDRDLTVGVAYTLGSPTATTSGANIDFTGIPSGVKQIVVTFAGVSTNGTSLPQLQIGDAGGIETTGYLSNAAGSTNTILIGSAAAAVTTGFILTTAHAAADLWHGQMTLTLIDASTFTWACSGSIISSSGTSSIFFAGTKSTSAELDRVRLTTVNGTDTFDAGKMNIAYAF